jgi:hypothetical protein
MTTTFELANGIYKAINGGAMIINLSLGSEGSTTMLYQVIQSGHEQGVLFFGAAGNQPGKTPTYPAAYPEVVAVTAGDARGNLAPYANSGDFVDVIAPGSATVNFNNQAWRVAGTSTSTAYATGMAAGLAEETKQSWAQIEAAIRKHLSLQSKQP